MTQSPPPPPPSRRPEIGKGIGTTLGFLTIPVAVIAGSLLGSIAGGSGGLVGLLVIVVLVATAILYGRRMPGFVRGVAWSVAIAAVLFTACVAILVTSDL